MPEQLYDPAYSVSVARPGQTSSRQITPLTSSVRWSTAAVGGFGACSFQVPYADLAEFPWLAQVRLFDGDELLWEGRIEDRATALSGDDRRATISCFGFQRLLQQTSVRRIWLLRSIPWRPSWKVAGLVTVPGIGVPQLHTSQMFCTVGQIEPTDLTRVGIRVGNSSTTPTSTTDANWAVYVAPEGITLERVKGTAEGVVAGAKYFAQDSTDGSTWTEKTDGNASTVESFACSANARYLLLGGVALGTSNSATWEDVRILCTTLNEDVSGGFYGGTIMRDLISLVPGLGVGTIDSGSEFTIESIARPVRDAAVSAVGEIASYYYKEWAVWEDRRFDWTTADLDSPHWVLSLEDCTQLDVDSSVQGLVKTLYVLYENAATGEPEEKNAASTDQRNPFVRTGDTSDGIVGAPVVMTGASAQKLADKTAADHGGFPEVRGRIQIPARRLVRNLNRGMAPANRIRGGDNVMIPELPSDEWVRPGRDGQTLFHITAAETDMEAGTTTVEFEGYSRRADVLLARLAAVTRAI